MDIGIGLQCAMHPLRANFHFVIFVLFDTATVICSALMHDPDHELPIVAKGVGSFGRVGNAYAACSLSKARSGSPKMAREGSGLKNQ